MNTIKPGVRVKTIRADVPFPLRWDFIGCEGTVIEPARFGGDWRVLLDCDESYHVVLDSELEVTE